jgi:hypothetical protein
MEDDPNVIVPFSTTAPDAVISVDCTLTNEAAPKLLTDAVGTPVEGIDRASKAPIFACTLPVEAPLRSNMPFTVSIPKTVMYPFIQFCKIRKFELIVTLEPDIESVPKISVMFTVAILLFYFFLN